MKSKKEIIAGSSPNELWKKLAEVTLELERKNRDLQIEASLERVRARTMAMQHSDELVDTAAILFKQVKDLGVQVWSCGFQIWKADDPGTSVAYMTLPDGTIRAPFEIPHTPEPFLNRAYEAAERGDQFLVEEIGGDALAAHYKYMLALPGVSDRMVDISAGGFDLPEFQINHNAFFSNGSLLFITYQPVPESWDIFKRFAKVFEQTYTRFLDLQKAEIQAMESQIELALERVRARTMAMQHSDELAETAYILFQQFRELGENPDQATIGIINEAEGVIEYWVTIYGNQSNKVFKFPVHEPNVTNKIYKAWKAQEKSLVIDLSGKALYAFSNFRAGMGGAAFNPEEKRRIINVAFFSKGLINVQSTVERSVESLRLLERFANVFESTYTRFLDLKNAEAQAREAKIEASLEKVRARAMAMHQSQDINNAVLAVFEELEKLDLDILRCGIGIIDRENKVGDIWTTVKLDGKSSIQVSGKEPMNIHPLLQGTYDAWLNQTDFLYELTGDDLVAYYRAVAGTNFTLPESHSLTDENHTAKQYYYTPTFKTGNLYAFRESPFPDDAKSIIKRFASVLNLTFSRFLDLKKAEAQGREAEIELGLERARARTMAMQKSDELQEIIKVVYEQLVHLNILVEHAGFIMDYNTQDDMHIWLADKHYAPTEITIPYFDSPHWNSFIEAKQKGTNFFANLLSFEEKNRFYQDLFKLIPGVTEETKEYYFNCPGLAISTVLLENVGLYIENFSGTPYNDDENSTLMRFGKVFQQAYTRFLDLQKAEAQVREAQIEAALEKVRSRSLAMHQTEELREVVTVVFDKLHDLGIVMEEEAASIVIFTEGTKDLILWNAIPDQLYSKSFHIPYYDTAVISSLLDAKNDGADFFKRNYTPEEKDHFWKWAVERSDYKYIPDDRKKHILERKYFACSVAYTKNSAILISSYAGKLLSEKESEILKRFARVFEQAYVRFLDLHKAEAQAREAQIELGLERVRARAMAMQNSNELNELIAAVFNDLTKLDLPVTVCRIWIFDPATLSAMIWQADSVNPKNPLSAFVKYSDRPFYLAALKAWKERHSKLVYELKGEEKKSWDEFLLNETALFNVPEVVKELIRSQECIWLSASFSNFGAMQTASLEPLSDEQIGILSRFVKVFDMTYTRFNDLKQAEAQSREAKIEAALERVRSRTMAMQKSDELAETVSLLFKQLLGLGIRTEQIRTCGIVTFDDKKPMGEQWITETNGEIIPQSFMVPYDKAPAYKSIYKAWKDGEKFMVIHLEGKALKEHLSFLAKDTKVPTRDIVLPRQAKEIFNHVMFFSQGCLFIITKEAFPEYHDVFKRFGTVFQQSYTRFLDLKKAEEQAREAQIEAALERVRGRTMAMQKSEELKEVIQLIYEQLKQLNFNIDTANFNLNFRDSNDFNGWIASPVQAYPKQVHTPYLDHPLFNNTIEAKENGRDFMAINLSYEEKNTFMDHFFKNASEIPEERKKYVFNSAGYTLSMILMKTVAFSIANYSGIPYLEAENAVLSRFGKVFEQTYTRFLDLQRAEAQIREATKQASLDRLRAEIASMRTTKDLERITPLIWNELTILGVPFIRCGVFIMDEPLQQIHTYLSTPDGKAIASFQLPFNAGSGNGVSQAALLGWRQKHAVAIHWTEEEFKNFSHTLVERGEIISEEGYLTERPPSGLDLHFFPFLQGMLYAGNTGPLSDDEKDLVQSLADAFSTAYARYEDFSSLELAKQEVERTLTDLKATQTKLIQSEKMASLGELTAGIAHEIQNPLNFVNNFSEVNQEMIDEMEEELNAGNIAEALAIAADIKQNEQKINHHGKRADAIVKGMLQHSRTGGAEKQLTNINSVADEYMRLSYHGLRAKDKAFNAEMVTHFDPDLPRINVIGQDIGRVFLNLFNNAFYAVNQKLKTAGEDYKPTVEVSTELFSPPSGDAGLIIKVKDNGVGMTDYIKEKIMQPFFTTKPTGEGTGLGLSLTYDMVVKGHGGSIQVNSAEGEGSEFIISLPVG